MNYTIELILSSIFYVLIWTFLYYDSKEDEKKGKSTLAPPGVCIGALSIFALWLTAWEYAPGTKLFYVLSGFLAFSAFIAFAVFVGFILWLIIASIEAAWTQLMDWVDKIKIRRKF